MFVCPRAENMEASKNVTIHHLSGEGSAMYTLGSCRIAAQLQGPQGT